MNRAVYSIISGGLAELSKLDLVAQNLANASTAGYKAQRAVFEVRPAKALGQARSAIAAQRSSAQVLERAVVTDLSQGPLEKTANPLDVALEGEGFFVVDTPRGLRFTRTGSFTIDRDGKLATGAGFPVQGEGGEIVLPQGRVEIARDGTVSVDGSQVARLRVVVFDRPEQLRREGQALFSAGPQMPQDLAPQQVRVVQGALEGANVSVVEDLVQMVETTRAFESYMRALERVDRLNGRAADDLGRV